MTSKVLVVDDDTAIRSVLRRSLERSGYHVAEATDGKRAAREIANGDFDLVVADILMPERDGLELILHLTKEQPDLKIIAISGSGNDLYLTCAEQFGAGRCFAKPFSMQEFVGAVDELLLEPSA